MKGFYVSLILMIEKMLKYIFLFLFILTGLHNTLAQQTYNFSGYISDKILESPIDSAFVQIFTDVDTLQLTTNSSGYYEGTIISTNVKEKVLPKQFDLISQNYPNPFNPGTTIQYSKSGAVELFDVTGRLVFAQTLNGDNVSRKQHLPAGVYFYRILADNGERVTNKMLLLDGSLATIRFVFIAGEDEGKNSAAKKSSEISAHYFIQKNGYFSIDTLVAVVSSGDNQHNFYLRQINYPPVIHVPDVTVERNGQTTLNLNNHVDDVDNDPSEMSWQAASYDTSIVDIDIADSIATITGKDRNGSTYVTWIAKDPHNASGQNNAKADIEFALKLIGQIYDGILDRGEPNIHVRLDGPNGIKDTLTSEDGRFAFYSKQAGNHTFSIVPKDTIMELEQVLEGLSDDYDMGRVGLTHADLPWIGYMHAQNAGVQNFNNDYAYNKRMASGLGLPKDPKTIPTFFIIRYGDSTKMKADIDSFNVQVDKGAAKYRLERPGMHNIVENTSTTPEEERQLWHDVYTNGEDGRFVILVQYNDGFGGGPSSAWNASDGYVSDGPHLSTKAGAQVYENWPYSVLYGEALAAMQNKSGEINTEEHPDWEYTIYAGGTSLKEMVSPWTYRNGIYYKEEMVDKMSNKVLTPGAKTEWNRDNDRFKVIIR